MCVCDLLELVDGETWRKLQGNITMQLFLKFGKVWVIDRKGSLNIRDWEGQNNLENNIDYKLFSCVFDLSISTGSASRASKKDWCKAFSIVVEVFDQQELLVQLKHGAGNFAEECCEASEFSQAIW